MTKSEIESRLRILRAHGKRILNGSVIMLGLNTIAGFIWMAFTRQMSKRQIVLSGLALFGIYGAICVVSSIAAKTNICRYAPRCPYCDSFITWANRDYVDSTGRCPKCAKRLVE